MRKPRVISLFSGAGGLDYGLEAAGFDTAVALELDHACCETLRANRRWPIIERDVFDVPTNELLATAGLRTGEADLLVGGPPCQPFSKSGYWRRGDALRLEDPRANTLSAYLRILREALPRAFLLENVEGLAYSGKDEGLKLLLDSVARINRETSSNYRPELAVLNAAEYGVPQLRERVFLIASRDGTRFAFPKPTHADLEGPGSVRDLFATSTLEPFRTAWDAIGDLNPDAGEDLAVRGKWARLLPSIPEGQNYLWHTDRMGGLPLFGWRRRYWSFLLKLAKNRPSWTIQAQPGPAVGPFHWDNRRLSMRELCRIQTFPDDVVIQRGRSAVQKQVGNAVPSLLAEVLGREIRRQLLRHSVLKKELKLLPPRRVPVPPERPVTRVPAEFRRLVGDHQAHPGTGKGTGALARLKASRNV
ncbi:MULTISPECIES: DNA cytosine methyltransferase [unclassified Anaeromyxobacter]|uniref:DNA cytosine methyltransferase n=1 Tax=unclassified Anaeromyxobacter TaxID=2620896 RepID=UPI001F5AA6F6|nr:MULTISPECIES: DNA cytosine methyltransferase [unclassified Anaeromyxobacter]